MKRRGGMAGFSSAGSGENSVEKYGMKTKTGGGVEIAQTAAQQWHQHRKPASAGAAPCVASAKANRQLGES
jgi:hypothetical protein